MELFDNNPSTYIRVVVARTGVSRMIVWNYLRKQLKRFPYKLRMSPTQSDSNKLQRLEFAQHCRRELRNDTRYLQRIIFSDECNFSVLRRVTKQNCRLWGTERPTEVHEVTRHSPTVMVWCAVSEHEIIEPYIFENETITGNSYKRMPRYHLMPRLRDYSDNMIFQQDGVPSHF